MTSTPDGAPARRPQRTDARRNRERLVAVAREAFAESGPDASLIEIARRTGVGQGTLYRHFPTRAALLAAVLTDRIKTLCAQAEELSRTRPADEALAEWLGLFLTHARVNQGLAGAYLVDGSHGLDPPEIDPPEIDCHRMIMDAARDLLTRAQRAGTVRADLTAEDLVQIVVGIALATARAGEPGQPGRLLSLVVDAVRHPPAPAPGS